jgi:tRNA nucleotidyltransferase/poly(A) polymerase
MEINFTSEELFIFNQISNSADECGMSAFIIGGFVRDKILNRANKDADIVCIGDGIELAKKLLKNFIQNHK